MTSSSQYILVVYSKLNIQSETSLAGNGRVVDWHHHDQMQGPDPINPRCTEMDFTDCIFLLCLLQNCERDYRSTSHFLRAVCNTKITPCDAP